MKRPTKSQLPPIKREPSGVPVGGQFAAAVHAETDMQLDPVDTDSNPARITELSYVGGSSDKFYRIEQDGVDVTIIYGRNGTAGKATTTTFDDEQTASVFAAKKLKAKLTKGYRSVAAQGRSAAAINDEFGVDETVLPMLAKIVDPDRVAGLIISDRWVAQLKLDGERLVVAVKSGQVAAFNRQGQPKKQNVTAEHLDAFRSLEGDWVFDGEIVDGTYHMFDIISGPGIGPESTFDARYAALVETADRLDTSTSVVCVVPVAESTADKQNLRVAAQNNHDEGIMFRRRTGLYENGRRSEDLVKDKFLKAADCVVTSIHPTKQSVELSVRGPDGKMVTVGRASTIGKGDLKVGAVVETTFLYVYDPAAPRMVQPRISKLRNDKSSDECSLDQFEHAGTNKADITSPDSDS